MADLRGYLDEPDGRDSISAGGIWIRGWALGNTDPVARVDAFLDGQWLGRARLGCPRPDVVAALGDVGAESSGFELWSSDPAGLRFGRASLQLRVTTQAGTEDWWTPRVLEIARDPASPAHQRSHLGRIAGHIEDPDGRTPLEAGWLRVRGWAYASVSPVSRVDAYLDGEWLGRAALGRPRPDVALALDEREADLSGFELRSAIPAGLGAHACLQLALTLLDGTEEVWPSLALAFHVQAPNVPPSHLDERHFPRPAPAAAPARVAVRGPRPREVIRLLWSARAFDRGGSQLRMAELIEYLAQTGEFESTVIGPEDGPLRPRLEAAGASVRAVGRIPLDDQRAYEASVSELCRWIEAEGGFDVVFGSTITCFPVVDAGLRLGVPSGLRIGEAAPFRTVVDWLHGALNHDIEARARAVFAGASVVVSNSEAAVRTYARDGWSSRFLVLRNGVDGQAACAPAPISRAERDECRRTLGIEVDQRLLVCAGTLWPVKGQAVLVTALEHARRSHPDLGCALVGAAEPVYAETIANFIARHLLTSAVVIVPFCDDLRPWWRAADAAVCVSESEALPAAVLEAMAHGLPVLACRTGDLPDLVEHGVTGWLCDDSNLAELIAALVEVAETPPDRMRAMGAAAQRRASLAPSHAEIHQAYAELLRTLAAGGRSEDVGGGRAIRVEVVEQV